MSVRVRFTECFDADYFEHDSDAQELIDVAFRDIRAVTYRWKSGPLPIQDFDDALNVHQVVPGIWAVSWNDGDGRLTFSPEGPDASGYPEALILRRVGGHAIYRDA